MLVEIINRSGRAVPRAHLEAFMGRLAREAAKHIAPKRFRGSELVIAFLPEAEARALNKRYRRKDHATDVLSFEGQGTSLGELVICPQVISRQAREHGHLVRDELAYMALHGFLHLLGYDHERGAAGAKRMFGLQDEIWAALTARQATAKSARHEHRNRTP